jgi:hypothetical protein
MHEAVGRNKGGKEGDESTIRREGTVVFRREQRFCVLAVSL